MVVGSVLVAGYVSPFVLFLKAYLPSLRWRACFEKSSQWLDGD